MWRALLAIVLCNAAVSAGAVSGDGVAAGAEVPVYFSLYGFRTLNSLGRSAARVLSRWRSILQGTRPASIIYVPREERALQIWSASGWSGLGDAAGHSTALRLLGLGAGTSVRIRRSSRCRCSASRSSVSTTARWPTCRRAGPTRYRTPSRSTAEPPPGDVAPVAGEGLDQRFRVEGIATTGMKR